MKRMAVLILVALWLTPALAAAEPLDDLLSGIAARYGKVKNLVVDFEQIAKIKQLGNREKKATGVIRFARPDKMRWEYHSAPAKQIITDGSTLVVWYIEEKKAYLTTAGGHYNVGLPMQILAGEVDVKTQYTPELLADDAQGRAQIKLTPRKSMGFMYLLLHVKRDGFFVGQIDTVDAYGNVTNIIMKNPRFNVTLPPGIFSYAPKPGVEIVDAPLMPEGM
jgi:outer membrane lipoprotein carrier protein